MHLGVNAQDENYSKTRKFIESASIVQEYRDTSTVAIIESGIGEKVSFFPVVVTDLKNGKEFKSLQMDMDFNCSNIRHLITSYIDLDEVSEFIIYLDEFVIPRLDKMTEEKKSNTYVFNSKEIISKYTVGNKKNRFSIGLKFINNDYQECVFWTEANIYNLKSLLKVLKSIQE